MPRASLGPTPPGGTSGFLLSDQLIRHTRRAAERSVAILNRTSTLCHVARGTVTWCSGVNGESFRLRSGISFRRLPGSVDWVQTTLSSYVIQLYLT